MQIKLLKVDEGTEHICCQVSDFIFGEGQFSQALQWSEPVGVNVTNFALVKAQKFEMAQVFERVLLNNDPIFIQLQYVQSFKTIECGARYLLQPTVNEKKAACSAFSQRELVDNPKVCIFNYSELWRGTVQQAGVSLV